MTGLCPTAGPCVSEVQRLLPLERQWRAGVSLVLPAALGFAPKLAALGLPLCAFKHLTGVPCPLCGGTRVCAALAQGDVAAALQLNPGLLPVLALAALHSGLLLTEALSGRALGSPWALTLAWKLAGGFWLTSWLWRVLGMG